MRYLPEPTNCDHCRSANIIFITSKLIWFCLQCGAATRCHEGTKTPLGRMADKETRWLRKKAHNAFDPLWKKRFMMRSRAYWWLANELNINFEDCHIGWLTKSQLKCAINLSNEYMQSYGKIFKKRLDKKHAKYRKRSSKLANRINRRKNGH